MAKRPSLSASFVVGEQPILDPTPKAQPQPQSLATAKPTPKPRDHRENRQAFTVWLDRDLIAKSALFLANWSRSTDEPVIRLRR